MSSEKYKVVIFHLCLVHLAEYEGNEGFLAAVKKVPFSVHFAQLNRLFLLSPRVRSPSLHVLQLLF